MEWDRWSRRILNESDKVAGDGFPGGSIGSKKSGVKRSGDKRRVVKKTLDKRKRLVAGGRVIQLKTGLVK